MVANTDNYETDTSASEDREMPGSGDLMRLKAVCSRLLSIDGKGTVSINSYKGAHPGIHPMREGTFQPVVNQLSEQREPSLHHRVEQRAAHLRGCWTGFPSPAIGSLAMASAGLPHYFVADSVVPSKIWKAANLLSR